TAPEPETPRLDVEGMTAPAFRRLDDRRFFAGLAAPVRTSEATIAVRHPRLETWSRRYHVIVDAPLPGTQATDHVRLAGGSGFGPLWIAAEPSSVQPAQGLRLLGTPVALGPMGAPIAQPLEA